ncbi:MAG: Protein-export membrane protein SecF [Parcubacteria group bacterium Gr01-1014_3]|nr:MAG: Protein-export membrane protein SecF [Parcubacteria group bacterium Gr01-1014_3]
MNVIGKKYIYLGFSGAMTALSIAAILFFGLKPGIDFAGGVAWELKFSENTVVKEELVESLINQFNVPDAIVLPQGGDGQSFLIRAKDITEQQKGIALQGLQKKFGKVEEMQFQNIGPTVGNDLRQKALIAFGLVLLGISLYVAFAFRKVSKPVSSWKYGIITLLTLFHDALIPAGMFAVLGYFLNVEVDTNFIVAVLVVMGFSVHDTIVVFDRIRENLRISFAGKSGSSSEDFNNLVNRSVNETMARSINTSLTLVLTLLALFFLGPAALKYFILVILVGTVFGTYSSIFIASPLLTLWQKNKRI